MFIDGTFNFCPAKQSLTGTSDVLSTNVLDVGSAKKIFGGAIGKGPKVVVYVTAIGGTSPTIRARLVAAGSADLSTTTPIILADSGVSRVIVAGDLPMAIELVPGDQLDAKRYYGVIFTQSGTNPTADVIAELVLDSQTNLLT